MKDNFSAHADLYASYRPTYPPELFEYILEVVIDRKMAWDCGTGNGQIATVLAQYFEQVEATDISEQQLLNAVHKPNINYSLQPAETANFPDQYFDLIIVAQAIHWFDFEEFYTTVKRTLKPGGTLIVSGYGMISIDENTDKIIYDFYTKTIGSYWDKERRYIDENYQTIPFPFDEIKAPQLCNKLDWNVEHLIGYLNTWSAVQHYIKALGTNPVDLIIEDLKKYWKEGESKELRFPVLLRAGRLV